MRGRWIFSPTLLALQPKQKPRNALHLQHPLLQAPPTNKHNPSGFAPANSSSFSHRSNDESRHGHHSPCALTQRQPGARSFGAHVVLSKERLEELLLAEITEFSLRPTRPLSLQRILSNPNPTEFLHKELPVRFASRIKQLEALPHFDSDQHILHCKTIYTESFKQLRTCNWKQEEDFAKTLSNLKRRHANIVPILAAGIRNLQNRYPEEYGSDYANSFMNNFFLSRIGTEMLTSQYLSKVHNHNPDGIIDQNCDPMVVLRRAAQDAEKICYHHYGCCPKIVIWNRDVHQFPYIPQYLYYILFELLKNSMRAVIEYAYPKLKSGGRCTAVSFMSSTSNSAATSSTVSSSSCFSHFASSPSSSPICFSSSPSSSSAPSRVCAPSPSTGFSPGVAEAEKADGNLFAPALRFPHGNASKSSNSKLRASASAVSDPRPSSSSSCSASPSSTSSFSTSFFSFCSSPISVSSSASSDPVFLPSSAAACKATLFSKAAASASCTNVGFLDLQQCPRTPPQYESVRWSEDMSHIQIVLSGDEQEVAIKIADQGGGIPRQAISKIWSYLYTTAEPVVVEQFKPPPGGLRSEGSVPAMGALDATAAQMVARPTMSPLAGFGCGLPLCRLYASYLGGSLQLISMPLYGTDAYLFLNKIGDKEELMPAANWGAKRNSSERGGDDRWPGSNLGSIELERV